MRCDGFFLATPIHTNPKRQRGSGNSSPQRKRGYSTRRRQLSRAPENVPAAKYSVPSTPYSRLSYASALRCERDAPNGPTCGSPVHRPGKSVPKNAWQALTGAQPSRRFISPPIVRRAPSAPSGLPIAGGTRNPGRRSARPGLSPVAALRQQFRTDCGSPFDGNTIQHPFRGVSSPKSSCPR